MVNTPTPWAADAQKKKTIFPPQILFFIKIFGGGIAVLLFIVFALMTVLSFFSRPASGIIFQYQAPRDVLVGEPFMLEVTITNESGNLLKEAKMGLFLPKTVVFVGREDIQSVFEEQVGDIPAGTVRKFEYELIAIDGTQSVAQIKSALSYRRPNASAEFKEESRVDVTIGRPTISVDYVVPQKIVLGQQFPIEIRARHQGRVDFSKVFITFEKPANFEIGSLSPEPQEKPATWAIDNFSFGEEAIFNVTGTVISGRAGNFVTLGSKIFIEYHDQRYEVVNKQATLPLSSAPLSLQLLLNGSDQYTPQIGQGLNYSLVIKNDSEIPLDNLTARLRLAGELFDYRQIKTNAFFNSTDSSFLWSAGNQSGLLRLAPGETRQLSVTLALRPDFPIALLSDKNYVIRAEAEVESPTIPPGASGSKISSKTSLQSRVKGSADFTAKAYYAEPDTDIENSGPFPPQANTPTQYTIHWAVKSTAVDLRDIEIVAFLQPQTRFTGRSYSNVGVDPIYNPASGQIVWKIPLVKANQGVIGPPAELTFQVEMTPSVSQVGSEAILIGEATFQATDAFVGQVISKKASALTTNLPFDTSIQGKEKRVHP
ncbi:MAG: hypothetical protein KGZ30_03810 [Anaplasmataceae bacterium]|nr:hypothetical protein [Anaplasmataceae bacterium]